MKTVDLFKNKTVLSYEVFPPKPSSPPETIYETLKKLKELSPDFVSVTYGAGGGKNSNETFKIASAIKEYGMKSVTHLPCIGLTKEEVAEKLNHLKEAGIENILALRGDIVDENMKRGDFKYASDLISYIKSNWDFNIIAACYPEGHIESQSRLDDLKNLKIKVDAGADQLISQLFFDNNYFYSFLEYCQLADINVPIEAGIMPVTNKRQIERMASLCGATVPEKFKTMMSKYENNPVAMRDAGIAYAIDQIVDLIAHGVSGIHIYTMNNPDTAKKIYDAVKTLI